MLLIISTKTKNVTFNAFWAAANWAMYDLSNLAPVMNGNWTLAKIKTMQ